MQKYGSRIPLVVGPIIAAVGFALFVLPGVGGTYWATFFPAVVVLGVGMAVSVAPLTTTVMSSVKRDRAGVASGINNAISRAAGLLAIAAFGIAIFFVFSRSLSHSLADLDVAPSVRQSLDSQRNRLAGIELAESIPPRERALMRNAIDLSFVEGFRCVMLIGSALALGGAAAALLLIRGNPKTSVRHVERGEGALAQRDKNSTNRKAMQSWAAKHGADAIYIESQSEAGGWRFGTGFGSVSGGSFSELRFRVKAIVWKEGGR